MIKPFLEIGEIVGTHSLHGEVRVNPWCDSPEFIKKFKTLYFDSEGRQSVRVKSVRPHGRVAVVKLEGTDTVEQAQALRGKMLWLRREDANLPEGKYFIAELTGCNVYDADNSDICYGTLTDVAQTGANDVWFIEKDGKEYLIPAIPDVIIKTDVEHDIILIRPLKGIFDDAD